MMQRFRKFGALRAPLKAATGFKKPAGLARLSTWTYDSVPIVQQQPRNDGFKYFESEAERERTKLMEENFEKILNDFRTSEARQTLILLLGMSENTKLSLLRNLRIAMESKKHLLHHIILRCRSHRPREKIMVGKTQFL